MNESLREKLAATAHDQWSGWMEYLFSKCYELPQTDGELVIPSAFRHRWQRQMGTPYRQLPEEEKRSDRIEADRILFVIENDAILKGK